MNFRLEEAMELLERTPGTLTRLLAGLSDGWLRCDEGEGTWNASQVVDHLIEAEKTNWLPRVAHLLRHGESEPFPPFDRDAHLSAPDDRPAAEKLAEFGRLRADSLAGLRELVRDESQRERTGVHPAFGVVKLRELLATWTVHDLTHIAQIARVMAARYREDVGPWSAYLGILKR